jgi:uncharacterized protein YbjT (DUF2867 family)
MRVLIIGGTGLISTSIAQQLLDRGDTVTVFNRGQTPVRVRGKLEILTGNRWEPGSLELISAWVSGLAGGSRRTRGNVTRR